MIAMAYVRIKRVKSELFTLRPIMFNMELNVDKTATDQCCYNILYRLHDVTALLEEL